MNGKSRLLVLLAILIALGALTVYRVQRHRQRDSGPTATRLSRAPEEILSRAPGLLDRARQGRSAGKELRQALEQLTTTRPGSSEAQQAALFLVELEETEDRSVEYEAAIKEVLDRHPEAQAETPGLLFRLGRLFAGPGEQPEQAAAVFGQMISLYPDCPERGEATIRLARILAKLGRDEEAVTRLNDLQRAHSRHPLADEALFLASTISARASRKGEATDGLTGSADWPARSAALRHTLITSYPDSPFSGALAARSSINEHVGDEQ